MNPDVSYSPKSSVLEASAPVGIGQFHEEITCEIAIGDEKALRNLTPAWRDLCNELHAPPYQRPDWIVAYVRAFEPRSEVVVASAYADGRLTAVLPMVRKNSICAGVPLVKLTGTANTHSVQFDVLRVPGAVGKRSVQVIWESLKRMPGWHLLELPMFPPDGGCEELTALADRSGFPIIRMLIQNSPILRLRVGDTGKAAHLVSGPSRHFRHELRRYARIFTEQTGESPAVTRCRDASSPLLQRFFELEASGRKGRLGSAIQCDPAARVFYEEIARLGNENGQFWLHSLDSNGKMAAGAFSVVTSDCFFPMKIAHDESLRRSGPGHLLFNAIVAECVEKQIPNLFFGGTEERFKTMWTQDKIPLFRTYVFSSDLRALLAYYVRKKLVTQLGRVRRAVKARFRNEHLGTRRRPDTLIPVANSKSEEFVSSTPS